MMIKIKFIKLTLYFIIVFQFFFAKSLIEKPFVVIVPSYNNINFYKKNLKSIFGQKYSNYRIIYIDDFSSDGTGQKVKKFIKKEGKENLVYFIQNNMRLGAMANHYKAAHLCGPDQIIVHLDGDDWFSDNYVLQYLNFIYSDPSIWLTYGQYKILAKKKISSCCLPLPQWVIDQHNYRNYPFVTSHLRSFYAGLFHQIKLKDLFYKGEFFSCSCDIAFMLPMIEMAHVHSKFLDKILYVYNCSNPIMDYRVNLQMQEFLSYYIRDKKPYSRLSVLPTNRKHDRFADVIIYHIGSIESLKVFVQQIRLYVTGYKNIYVLSDLNNYVNLDVKWVKIENKLTNYFLNVIEQDKSNYVILCTDICGISKPINIADCISQLEKTYAKGFFLALGKKENFSKKMNLISDNIYAWQFKYSYYKYKYPELWKMALIRKSDLSKLFYKRNKELNFFVPIYSKKGIGLCYEQASCYVKNILTDKKLFL